MGNEIDTVTARNQLTPRLFRQYSSDSRDPQTSLGPLTRCANHERFDQAVALARQWMAHGDDTLQFAAAGSCTQGLRR